MINPYQSYIDVFYPKQFSLVPIPARSVTELNDVDKDDVISDMQDWETYMYCKEFQECFREIPDNEDDDVPCIRGLDTGTKQSQTYYMKNGRKSEMVLTNGHHEIGNDETTTMRFSPSFSKMQIRSHENSTDELNEEEKKSRDRSAQLEKARGNVAYNKGQFEKACEYYSNSIRFRKLKEAYNNRAQANMKLNNFTSAIPDLNEVLKQDPVNTKALYRRALCFEAVRMYYESQQDLSKLFKQHNAGKEARSLSERLTAQLAQAKEKTYIIRQNFDLHTTIKVDISQLWSYATVPNYYNKNYLIEVDATGCSKQCVCGFCSEEDRRNRKKTNNLRIREPSKWKVLTSELLEEMKIPRVDINDIQKTQKNIYGNTGNLIKKMENGDGNRKLFKRCSKLVTKDDNCNYKDDDDDNNNNNVDINSNNNVSHSAMNNNININTYKYESGRYERYF